MRLLQLTLAFLILVSTAHAAPPVFERMRVKIQIYKKTIDRVGDVFRFTEETVCEKNDIINVYDFRQSPVNESSMHSSSCETSLNGQPLTLTVYSDASVDKIKLFGRSELVTVKNYFSELRAYTVAEMTNFPEIPASTPSYTKDLNLKNLIHNLAPNQGLTCFETGPIDTIPHPTEPIPGPNLANSGTIPAEENCQIFNPVGFGAVVEFETL